MNYVKQANEWLVYQENQLTASLGFLLINEGQTVVIERLWCQNETDDQLKTLILSDFCNNLPPTYKNILPLTPFAQKFFQQNTNYQHLLFRNY